MYRYNDLDDQFREVCNQHLLKEVYEKILEKSEDTNRL